MTDMLYITFDPNPVLAVYRLVTDKGVRIGKFDSLREALAARDRLEQERRDSLREEAE